MQTSFSTSPSDPIAFVALFNGSEIASSDDDAEESAEEESNQSSAKGNQHPSSSSTQDETKQKLGSNYPVLFLDNQSFLEKLEKRLPDCYDQTPRKREKQEAAQDISSIEMDEIFQKEFIHTYYTLSVFMNFSDDDLLKYSSSQRDEFAALIDVFLKNRHRVKQTADYQQFEKQIYDRFAQAKFAKYFH